MIQATITDVARRAGVSERTVSRVINASPMVNEETRARVLTVIQSLNYVPSLRARALASKRSSLIGLLHDDPNAAVLDLVQRGIFTVCAERGYELVVHPCRITSDRLVEDVLAFARRSRADGLVLTPPVSESAALAQALLESAIPTVAIASVPLQSVGLMLVSREREAAAAMAEHLVQLGHRHFGLVLGPRTFKSASEREAGFRETLRAHDLNLLARDVLEGDYSFASGVACAERLLRQKHRPTAIFACNDRMAAGVLKVAIQQGLAVPADLSVAGFDDSEFASMMTPSLTTIRRPFREMAEAAARWLTGPQAAYGVQEPDTLCFNLTVVARDSTGPVPERR